MTITAQLTHDHDDGTILDIEDLRPHPTAKDAVKAAGFRWSRNVGWYLPRSRDKDLAESKAAGIEATLNNAGIELNIQIDNDARDFETKMRAKTGRAAQRAEALNNKADRLTEVADSRHRRASDMGAMIPLGQPVLIGHHSAPRHKRHLAKIRNELKRAVDTSTAAKATRQRASAATRTADTSKDGTFLVNRILEAERNKAAETVEEIVSYMAKQGFTFVDPSTLAPGQRWHVRRSYVEIVRVNKKTATVKAIFANGNPIFPGSITNRIDLRYFHFAPGDIEDARQFPVKV